MFMSLMMDECLAYTFLKKLDIKKYERFIIKIFYSNNLDEKFSQLFRTL